MPRPPAAGAPRPGGGAGAAALRARIEARGFGGFTGPEAYSAYMRSLRKKAPEDLPAIGGRAAHRSLIQQLGEDGYRDRQRAGFQAACAKHGRNVILGHIARAHEERRHWRLSNPTRGEKALRETLRRLGLAVHPLTYERGEASFEYWRWHLAGEADLGPCDLVLEARVGPYFVDVMIPRLSIAFEVEGGIHLLRPLYDEQRREWLESLGFTVYTFTNDEALAGLDQRLIGVLAPFGHLPRRGQIELPL